MSTKQQPLTVPVAIIIAAVIIGIALVLAFGGGEGSGGSNQAGTAPATTDGRISIEDAAKKVGIKERDLTECVENQDTLDNVNAEIADARDSGARGTPYSVLIGPNGQTLAVSGAQQRAAWDAAIDQLLSGTYTTPDGDVTANVQPVGANDLVRGNPDAPVTIVEFSDIDCPFCQRVHPTLEQLLADRPDDVNWVYRHFPIPQLHPNATAKAIAAECVYEITNDADKYWEYLDLLVAGA